MTTEALPGVEKLTAALEAADIGYSSNGYVDVVDDTICIDGTYDISQFLKALEPDEAAREAIIRRIAAALAIQFPWTIEVVMPLARAAYEAEHG